jgi:hypothetical protein
MQLVIRDLSKTYPTVPRPADAEGSGALSPKLREGGEPARAGIDPRRKLIERGREDNVVEVKAAGADPAGAGS